MPSRMGQTRNRRHGLFWAIVVALTVVQPLGVLTQSTDQQANSLVHRLMSPYCPGLLLADCRSEGAQELRGEILRRLQAGEAPDAIERDLVTRFGPAIRTEPEFNGIGLLAWLSPFVFAVAGLGFVFIVVRRAASRDPASVARAGDDPERDAEMNERLQDELDALD
jgi:cytochrome c-type biogenesis protein CcmH